MHKYDNILLDPLVSKVLLDAIRSFVVFGSTAPFDDPPTIDISYEPSEKRFTPVLEPREYELNLHAPFSTDEELFDFRIYVKSWTESRRFILQETPAVWAELRSSVTFLNNILTIILWWQIPAECSIPNPRAYSNYEDYCYDI